MKTVIFVPSLDFRLILLSTPLNLCPTLQDHPVEYIKSKHSININKPAQKTRKKTKHLCLINLLRGNGPDTGSRDPRYPKIPVVINNAC